MLNQQYNVVMRSALLFASQFVREQCEWDYSISAMLVNANTHAHTREHTRIILELACVFV